MKTYNTILAVSFFIFALYSLINIKETSQATFKILTTFAKNILPALFPFLILNQLLIKLGIIDFISYFFQFISYPLFKISGKGASIIIIGLLNGFPSSVIFTSLMLVDKQIDKHEAQRLINYIFFPSISFLFAILNPNINNSSIFIKLILSLYLSGFILLYLSSFKVKECPQIIPFKETISNINDKIRNFTFSKNIKEIITYSFNTLLNILGIIIIFSIPSNIINKIVKNNINYLFKGLIEFAIPSIELSLLNINKKRIVLYLSAILSFSGLSSIMQANLFINEANLDAKQFILNRILISFFTTILLSLFLFFFQ